MCQMIVFWHSCGHLYASYLQCPFKGLDRHEEDLATAATVDAGCWACKVTECPVTRNLRKTLLTVEHLEGILGESSTDPGFLDSVVGFYAHGDHSRYWDQPGHSKAGYVEDDPYMDDMCAEVYLEAAARTGEFACNAGFAFDLEVAQAARNDPKNNNNLNWFARGAYPNNPLYYQLSDTSLFQPPRDVSRSTPTPRDGGVVRRFFPSSGEFIHKRQASNPRYGNATTLTEDSLLASAFQPDDSFLSTKNRLTNKISQLSHDTTGSIHNDPVFDNSNSMILSLSKNTNGPMSDSVESSVANSLAVSFQSNDVVPTQSDVADPFVDTVTSFVPNITTPSFSNGATTPFLERLIDSMQNDTASLNQGELTSRIQTNAVVPIQGGEEYDMDDKYARNTINDSTINHDTGQPIGERDINDPAIVKPNDGFEVSSHGHSSTGTQREGEYFQNQQHQDPQQYQHVFLSYQAYYQLTRPTPTPTAEAFPEPSMDPTSPDLPPLDVNYQTFSEFHDVSAFMLDDASMDANPPSSDTIEDWSSTYGQDSVRDVMQDYDREPAKEVYSQTGV